MLLFNIKNMRWVIVLSLIFLFQIVFAENVILVSDNFADKALAEIVQKKFGWKIVETPWGKYEKSILNTVINYNPKFVLIIGGEVAVPKIYEEELLKLNISVQRISGKNRIETAINVAKFLNLTNVVITNGYDPISIKKALELAIKRNAVIIFVKQKMEPDIEEIIKKAKRKILIKTPGLEIKEKGIEVIEEDVYNKTLELINEVKKEMEEVKEKLKNETNKGIIIAVSRILENAEKVLNKSIERLKENKTVSAYNLAISAMYMVDAAERILERAAVEKFMGLFKKELKELREEIKKMKEKLKKMRKEFIRKLNETMRMCAEMNLSEEECKEKLDELKEEYKEKMEEIAEEIWELKYEFIKEMREKTKEYKEKMHELMEEMREKMKEFKEKMREMRKEMMEEMCEEMPGRCMH